MGTVTPTNEEYDYEGKVIISQTDTDGILTYVNKKILTSATQGVEIPAFVGLRNPREIDFSDDGFVVRDLSATFFIPAKLGDLIEVKTEIVSIKRSFLNIIQKIYKDDFLLFELKIRLVFLKNRKISTIPENYRNILKI